MAAAEQMDPEMMRQWMHAMQQRMDNVDGRLQHQEQHQQHQQQNNNNNPGDGLRVQIKLPQPESFLGGSSSISPSQWLSAMEHYLGLTRVNADQEKIVATAGYFKASALGWWLQNKDSLIAGSWDEFKEIFLRYFQPVNAAETARARLFVLKQSPGYNGFLIYRDRFHRLISEIPNMGEEEKLSHFKNGLLPETKKHVLMARPKTCHEAMELGGLVEEANRSATNGGVKSFKGPMVRPVGRGTGSGITGGSNYVRPAVTGASAQGVAPMELGSHIVPEMAVMNGPPPSQNPNYLCFLCGGRGHGVARCPQLNRARAAIGKPPVRPQPRPNYNRPQFSTQVVEEEDGIQLEYHEGEYWEMEELPEDYVDPVYPEEISSGGTGGSG